MYSHNKRDNYIRGCRGETALLLTSNPETTRPFRRQRICTPIKDTWGCRSKSLEPPRVPF
jgi:hypothetical protein